MHFAAFGPVNPFLRSLDLCSISEEAGAKGTKIKRVQEDPQNYANRGKITVQVSFKRLVCQRREIQWNISTIKNNQRQIKQLKYESVLRGMFIHRFGDD